MSRGVGEKCLWILVSVISNLAAIPTIFLLVRQKRRFEVFVSLFTLLCSVMYHLCDSLEWKGAVGIWIGEGSWHRFDNVGAIMCFVVWFVYLSNIKRAAIAAYVNYAAFGIVLLLQEKAPWDVRYTFGPILAGLFGCVGKWFLYDRKLPRFNTTMLKRGAAIQLIGVVFFIKALDDSKDPYRFYHGCWHFFTSIAAWHNWQLLPQKKKGLVQ